MRKIVVLGATSRIAQETVKEFAKDKSELFLADISLDKLREVAADLKARFGVNPHLVEFDAMNFKSHAEIFNQSVTALGDIDAVLVAYGTLPTQAEVEQEADKAVFHFNLNATSVISLLTYYANYFEKRRAGTIAVISSVAGDRGRQSNYLYGAAKGALTRFLQGLRNRLTKNGVNVLTIKPGMVDTPMTAHMKKGPLFAKPETIGRGIHRAMVSGKYQVYLPGYWRLVMFIVRHIPEPIFRKLSL
ncbi:MAG: SDR family oxidoreductase [Chloroflexota bacterium]